MELYGLELMADFPTSIPRQRRSIPIIKNTWLIDVDGSKNRITNYSVKAIIEDRNGDLLIGTWSSGLMRFRRGGNTFYRYPQLNEANSAYSLFLDKHNRLWVEPGDTVLCVLDNPQNVRQPEMHQYPYSTNHFDIFYKIVHDPVTKTLWALYPRRCVLSRKRYA